MGPFGEQQFTAVRQVHGTLGVGNLGKDHEHRTTARLAALRRHEASQLMHRDALAGLHHRLEPTG